MAQIAIPLIISIGVSLLASLLLKPKEPDIDFGTATPVAKRGTLIPYLIGRRMLGSLFGFAGGRIVVKEKTGAKGKGGSGQKQNVYYEQGWHLLSFSGVGAALREIQKSGRVIFSGPITPASHPSGSIINLGKEGSFAMYWGEDTQPINTALGNRNGIYSRWPGVCSVYWTACRLGLSPRWPALTYVFEVGLDFALLTKSTAYHPPSVTPGTETFALDFFENAHAQTPPAPTTQFAGAGSGAGFFRVAHRVNNTGPTHLGTKMQPGKPFELSGTTNNDGLYTVYATVETVLQAEAAPGAAFGYTEVFWDVYPVEAVANFSESSGSVRPYTVGNDDGYNPAHMIAQLLFGPFPLGFSLPQDLFDIESLEALGLLLNIEEFWGSVISRESGADLDEILGHILQDVGCFITLDTSSGLYKFVPIRESGDIVPHFGEEFLSGQSPEIETFHGEKKGSRVVFVFEDQDYNYRDNTIGGLDDDGEFRLVSYFKSKKVRMVLPTVFAVAAKAALRRSQEEQGSGSAVSLTMNRGARLLTPGSKFTADGTIGRLLCVSNLLDPLTSVCKVAAIADFVSATASSSGISSGDDGDDILSAESPLGVSIVEVPPYLAEGMVLVTVPIIRAHEQVLSHDIWLSDDDVTYRQVLQEQLVQTGGTLTAALTADTGYNLAAGTYSFDDLGPDITTLVYDYSGSDSSWRRGLQVLVVDKEIMFLDGVTHDGTSWVLGRLLRGRLGSPVQAHAAGSTFFIMDLTDARAIKEPEIYAGNTIYVKVQANAADSVPLSSLLPFSLLVEGKGIIPFDPVSLMCRGESSTAFTNTFEAGDDLSFKWGYLSAAVPKTGAGMQGAGNAHGSSPSNANFIVEILTSGDVLKKTLETGEVSSFAYTNVDLVADFSGEPASFKVSVRSVGAGSSSSNPITLTINKV